MMLPGFRVEGIGYRKATQRYCIRSVFITEVTI